MDIINLNPQQLHALILENQQQIKDLETKVFVLGGMLVVILALYVYNKVRGS